MARTGRAVAGLVAMIGVPSVPAVASDASPRLQALVLRPVPTRLRSVTPRRSWLPPGGSYGPAITRERARYLDAGPITIGVRAARMTSLSIGRMDGIRSADRFSIKDIGVDAALNLSPDLSVRTFATATRMRRRFGPSIDRDRPLGTAATGVGLGIEHAGLGVLDLEYDRIGGRGRRYAWDAVSEAIDGMPSGQGFRLSLANGGAGPVAGRLGWSLSAMALRRSAANDATMTGGHDVIDRRAEATLRFGF